MVLRDVDAYFDGFPPHPKPFPPRSRPDVSALVSRAGTAHKSENCAATNPELVSSRMPLSPLVSISLLQRVASTSSGLTGASLTFVPVSLAMRAAKRTNELKFSSS